MTVVVYRERGTGGLTGQPGLLLQNPLENVDIKDIASVTKAFDLFIQTDRFTEAEALLEKTVPQDDTARAWLLSHKAHLAFLQWLDGGCKDDRLLDGVLSPVAEILSKLPTEAPKQSAMQAFCRVLRMAEKDENLLEKVRCHFPKYAEGLRFLGEDRETKGDWSFHYGNSQYILCGMGRIADWSDTKTLETSPYKVEVFGQDHARRWLDNANRNVSSPEALLQPTFLFRDQYFEHILNSTPDTFFPLLGGKTVRRASWWDDHGEMHPFDDEGPDLSVSFTPRPVGKSFLSWYFNDFDWRRTAHPRQQSMLVFNNNNQLLGAEWIGKLDDGVYLRFVLEERQAMKIRFNKHRGACVAVNGIFVDAPIRFSDTSLSNYGRNDNFKPCTDKEISKRAGMLPPSAGRAFQIAMTAEQNLTFHPSREEYIQAIHGIKQAKELVSLLDAYAKVDNIHDVWFLLAMTRLWALLDEMEEGARHDVLKNVFQICYGPKLEILRYPLAERWRKENLPRKMAWLEKNYVYPKTTGESHEEKK